MLMSECSIAPQKYAVSAMSLLFPACFRKFLYFTVHKCFLSMALVALLASCFAFVSTQGYFTVKNVVLLPNMPFDVMPCTMTA